MCTLTHTIKTNARRICPIIILIVTTQHPYRKLLVNKA